ncbi:MAG: DUF4368 domain-containing protein, partial [Oscillospiraceae bacterium]
IDKVKGVIDEETYAELSRSFSEEYRENEEQLIRTREHLLHLRTKSDDADTPVVLVRRYADSGELTFTLLRCFIEKIVVHPKKPYSRQDEIDIYWDF